MAVRASRKRPKKAKQKTKKRAPQVAAKALPRQLSITEARDSFTSVVQRAESGPPIGITRRGKLVAYVVSASDLEARMRGNAFREALRRWDAIVEASGLTEEDLTLELPEREVYDREVDL